MLNIPIDEQNFHVNNFSSEELLWGKTTYLRVLKRYPELNKFVSSTLQPLNLTDAGMLPLMVTVTLAFRATVG